MMTYKSFIERVRERTGCESREAAELAIAATVEVVGQRLINMDKRFVASQLPKSVAEWLLTHREQEDFDLGELYQRVSEREAVSLGFAMEHAQVVCQVLAESVDREGLAHLRLHVPEEWAELFTIRSGGFRGVPSQYATGEHATPNSTRTLSGGRSGSFNPVSEARAERSHSGSVVAVPDTSDNT